MSATVLDALEQRELLTIGTGLGQIISPLFRALPNFSPNPPSSALTPTQVRAAYGFDKINFGAIAGNGAGITVAIVDAYDSPTIQADLNVFSAKFGLPTTTITRVNQNGGTAYPSTDTSGGWEEETALDVEWVHAIAPAANILLVEANSAYDSDLLTAVRYAAAHSNVVSLSWGGSEFASETSSTYENNFVHSGTVFTVSSGDNGAPISWPASSPNVVSIGGTTLRLASNGTISSETGWSGSGGGPSAYEAKPTYQSKVVNQSSTRANPDVSYDADPNTGFATYSSFAGSGGAPGWFQVGGTSAGAPQWAALFAIADQGRTLAGKPVLNATDPQEAQKILYANAGTSAFRDINSGSSNGSPVYSSTTGYDFVTGLGSPIANLVVAALGAGVTAPVGPDTFVVTATPSTTAGSTFTITVTAKTPAGTTDTGYVGNVKFTSSDVQAGLPANFSFTTANHGVATFNVSLKTSGSQTITATDTANASVIGKATTVVSPAAASQFIVTGLSTSVTVGSAQTFTITTRDAYGNLATNYTGTVGFSSSDPSANLPVGYTFTSTDQGAHAFSVKFNTSGTQSLTITGSGPTLSLSVSGISVSPASPLNLTATAASNTQINLSWTASAGATGYNIQRSLNGSTGWTQIGVTSGVTTYQDTGLTAGTTYYYRVQATGGSASSLFGNVTSATTTGAVVPTGTAKSIWGTSFTPRENTYSAGNYTVGEKFTSDTSGVITGVSFYKAWYMDGWTHVGYLWSSSGSLLGTATFNNESASGWQQVTFASPVAIAANQVYIVSFSTGGGYFGITTNYFSRGGVDAPPLHALSNGTTGGNGVYGFGNGAFPTNNAGGMNFWADVTFSPTSSSASAKSTSSKTTTTGLVAPSGPGLAFSNSPAPATHHNTIVNHRRGIRPAVVTQSLHRQTF
jgi:hypothetical protein